MKSKRIQKLRKRYLETQSYSHQVAWEKAVNLKFISLNRSERESFFTLHEIVEILRDEGGNVRTTFYALNCLKLKLDSNRNGDFHSECVRLELPKLVQDTMMREAFTTPNHYETIIVIWEAWFQNVRMRRFATDQCFRDLNLLWIFCRCNETWCKFAKLLAIYPNDHFYDPETTQECFRERVNEAKDYGFASSIKDCDVTIARLLKWNLPQDLRLELKAIRNEVIEDVPRIFSVSCSYCRKEDVKFSCPCGFAHFCNRSHQKKYWLVHRHDCTFKIE